MRQENIPWADYIGYDSRGYEYNTKYPPNAAGEGSHKFNGYSTANQGTFFFDVAVNLYGVKFSYNGINYSIPSDGVDWRLIDNTNNKISIGYPNPLAHNLKEIGALERDITLWQWLPERDYRGIRYDLDRE